MEKLKIILMIIIIIILLIILIGGLIGNYFYNLALNPNTDKSMILNAPNNKVNEESNENNSENWLETVGYKEEYIYSQDKNLKLHSYSIEKEGSDLYVILVHGYTSEGSQMFDHAEKFYEMGYNVLIPDLRGHGKSEGDYIGMGWHDRNDIIAWSNRIIEKNEKAKIVLYGISMGAATVMMVSGEELPSNIKVIIEDCGYTTVEEEFTYQLKEIFNLPKFPVINLASIVTRIKAGYSLKEASAVEQVAKSKTPILFIHGDEDTFVPSYMIEEVYNAANCEKEKLIIKGAGHAEASTTDPTLYWSVVETFINKYIK